MCSIFYFYILKRCRYSKTVTDKWVKGGVGVYMTFSIADFDSDIMLVNRENVKYPRVSIHVWAINRKTKHTIVPIPFQLGI